MKQPIKEAAPHTIPSALVSAGVAGVSGAFGDLPDAFLLYTFGSATILMGTRHVKDAFVAFVQAKWPPALPLIEESENDLRNARYENEDLAGY